MKTEKQRRTQYLAVEEISDYLKIICTITDIIVHKNDRIFIGFSNRQTGTIQPVSGQAITRIIQKYARKAGITHKYPLTRAGIVAQASQSKPEPSLIRSCNT
jgi:hypothetical protein